jgi:hypothetical protein
MGEQARINAFVCLIATVGCWVGFAHQLHIELREPLDADVFGVALVLWLLGGVLTTVLLTIALTVTAMHNYFGASPAPGEPAKPAPGVQP